MKTRYKYLLVNIIWCLILSICINITFYLKLNECFIVINKVLIILLILSSLLSQVDASKKSDKEFSYGFFTMRNVFYGVFFVFVAGWICVILVHCFFDYQTFYFQKYIFALLHGFTFSIGICRMYLSE
jgi:hypothetical protein